MRKTWISTWALAALSIAILSSAEAKPNFSGTWKLNAEKSDYGPIPAPEKLERKVIQTDSELKYSTTQINAQGEFKTDLAYPTDGTSTTNKTPRGDVTGKAKWDGDALVIDSQRKIQDVDITSNERWTISGDGKLLTIVNKLNTPQGDFEIKQVLEKQ